MDIEDLKKYDEHNRNKKSKKRKIIISIITILVIMIISIFLVIIYLNKDKTNLNKTESKQTTEVEKKKLSIVDEDSNKRPIAVMLDNNIGNELHAGLQESYINYEIIVEGGLTRIMAIFKDKDVSLIGPVRSSRHYFLDYSLESDCIYTHYGWSPYAEKDIPALGVNNINGLYDDDPFWRDKSIAAPHNVFTTTDKIYAYATNKNYKTTTDDWKLLKYSTDEVDLSTPIETKTEVNEETGKKEKVNIQNPELIVANSISIPYSNYQTRSYTYDSTRKVYLRYMNEKPHLDKTTKQQLYYKNIIIMKVSNSQLDSDGRQDLQTTGTGEGYYITNGYALPITWTKSSRSAKTKYTYSDGTEVKVNDGNTFIQIEPSKYSPTIN